MLTDLTPEETRIILDVIPERNFIPEGMPNSEQLDAMERRVGTKFNKIGKDGKPKDAVVFIPDGLHFAERANEIGKVVPRYHVYATLGYKIDIRTGKPETDKKTGTLVPRVIDEQLIDVDKFLKEYQPAR